MKQVLTLSLIYCILPVMDSYSQQKETTATDTARAQMHLTSQMLLGISPLTNAVRPLSPELGPVVKTTWIHNWSKPKTTLFDAIPARGMLFIGKTLIHNQLDLPSSLHTLSPRTAVDLWYDSPRTVSECQRNLKKLRYE